MQYEFKPDMFSLYIDVVVVGIASGITLGFIAWAIGYAVNAIIKIIKMA